jgi:hypothetical protein
MSNVQASKRDFFISFNKADRLWATWIAWVLEETGYSVFFQDWDFRGNFVEHMNRAHSEAQRTLAVLSDYYFSSEFTLPEWSARFAQDPASREDRLVPAKVGTLKDDTIFSAIVYADLTNCPEEVARDRLLDRVKKAVDAGFRSKPLNPPGFPGSPPRQFSSKPEFPREGALPTPALERSSRTAGDKSVTIGRDAIGSIIATGDNNSINPSGPTSVSKTTTLPISDSVDIVRELEHIRAILNRIGGENASKIRRALDDADEEARKARPNKNEIGTALERAIDYANKGGDFADHVEKLTPYVTNAVAWLGSNWHKLLPLVGLVV